jgi:hypothetical protein
VAIYNYTTLATVRQELANRLYDPTQTFWSPEMSQGEKGTHEASHEQMKRLFDIRTAVARLRYR